jgi:hypothetical protein
MLTPITEVNNLSKMVATDLFMVNKKFLYIFLIDFGKAFNGFVHIQSYGHSNFERV